MNKPIATILTIAGLSAAFAETSVNTGKSGLTPETKYPWEHSISAGVTLTRGNSETALFTADFTALKKTPINEYSFGIAGAYGNNKSVDTVNNYKAFGQWNHLFNERLYGYLRADALRDHVADLDYRFTIGPGVGYYFIKDKMTYLAGEAGVAFEAQHLGKKSETFATARLADRFEHKFNDHARLWQSAEFLPQVDQFDNYVVNFEIGIETSVTKSFTLKTYLDDTYQNRPALGRKKNDVQIVAALGYKF
jgi:putative salt-induced outer membrane protein YdiY